MVHHQSVMDMQAMSSGVVSSLNALARRVFHRRGSPLLETAVILSMPIMTISPKLQEIQQCIDNVVQEVRLGILIHTWPA